MEKGITAEVARPRVFAGTSDTGLESLVEENDIDSIKEVDMFGRELPL